MFGGAVHLRNDQNKSNIVVNFVNNTFDKNMAYFEGNSVFVDGFRTVHVNESSFTKNYGRNIGTGAALAVRGVRGEYQAPTVVKYMYRSILNTPDNRSMNKIDITHCHFVQNYGGSKGSAMNFIDVESLTLEIIETKFINNSAAFSIVEDDLPFYKYLTQQNHKLNYFSFDDCAQDEI